MSETICKECKMKRLDGYMREICTEKNNALLELLGEYTLESEENCDYFRKNEDKTN